MKTWLRGVGAPQNSVFSGFGRKRMFCFPRVFVFCAFCVFGPLMGLCVHCPGAVNHNNSEEVSSKKNTYIYREIYVDIHVWVYIYIHISLSSSYEGGCICL